VEYKETTNFYKDGYKPMGELYDNYPTKSRAVLLTESDDSYTNFLDVAKRSLHRHDLRFGIVRDSELIQQYKDKIGKDNFRQETHGVECLVIKNRANKTVSFVEEGRMLD
jgi:hypothetical protein